MRDSIFICSALHECKSQVEVADAFQVEHMNMEKPVVCISCIYLIYACLNSTTGGREKKEFEGNCNLKSVPNKSVLLLRNGPNYLLSTALSHGAKSL